MDARDGSAGDACHIPDRRRERVGASACVRACVRAWYLRVFAAAVSSTSSPLATTTDGGGGGGDAAVVRCPSPPPPAKLSPAGHVADNVISATLDGVDSAPS